jgi:hypothetical protein
MTMTVRVSQTVVNKGALPETSYTLWCPGCEDVHRINDGWQFDGNLEAPTFSPSILTHWGKYQRDHSYKRFTCHSFIRSGMWEFLTDSDHALAGKTVPMVDLPDWLAKE